MIVEAYDDEEYCKYYGTERSQAHLREEFRTGQRNCIITKAELCHVQSNIL